MNCWLNRILRPVNIAAFGVVFISCLAAWRGNYEAAGTFLGTGAFAYFFLRSSDD
jgi:hypothetical protein